MPFIVGGGKAGKGMAGAFTATGKAADNAGKKVKRFNGFIGDTAKEEGKVRKQVHAKAKAGSYSVLGQQAEKAGKQAQKASGGFKEFARQQANITKKVIGFGAVTAAIRGITSGMGDMVQNTFELDSALTEFKKVSNLSGKALEDYTDQAFKAGRQTARTGTEMIEASTQFKKMGYDEKQSMQLATTATMFQNIADAEISAGDAALFINSQLKGFSSEFSKFSSTGEASMHVIDSVNEV